MQVSKGFIRQGLYFNRIIKSACNPDEPDLRSIFMPVGIACAWNTESKSEATGWL